MTSSLPAGLRERKKAKTRAAIREAALRLFDEQGYAATTVDQIAEAAEVSQSTFFRYFPTKEDVIVTDDYDPALADALRAQPADLSPVDAVIAAMREVFGKLGPEERAVEMRRQRHFTSVPELRARLLHQTVTTVDLLADALAARTGRPADDLRVRVLAGAIVGTMLAVAPVEDGGGMGFYDLDRIAAALAVLRDGFATP